MEDLLLIQDPTYDHVRDVLEQMRKNESTSYRRPLSKPIEPFNGLWRQQIVEWMYTLVKHCKLRHESAAAGAYFLDVAVARGVIETPSDYQLGAMTALYLGLKVFDSPSMRVVRLSSLVKLGNASFKEEDVVRMEQDMVKAMGWRLNPATPNCFLQQFLVLLPTLNDSTKTQIEEKALKVIEVAVATERFYSMKPSVLGYSALLIALDQYLESQKLSIPDCGTETICLWQVRTFLYNMKHFAKLDHTSVLVSQTTSMLDRAFKPLTAANPHEPSKVYQNTSKHYQSHFEWRGSNSASSSPNNVALQ
jgi:hypothetical protein